MTTAASRDDSVVAIRQLAGRGGGEAGERLSIVLSSKDGRRSAAGAESSRTGARPAAYSGVWNSWDLASVAAGFVSTVSSKRSFAFSSSLQLVLGVVAISSSLQLGLPLPPVRGGGGGMTREIPVAVVGVERNNAEVADAVEKEEDSPAVPPRDASSARMSVKSVPMICVAIGAARASVAAAASSEMGLRWGW